MDLNLPEDIGAWLAVNSVSKYRTCPSKDYGQGPSKIGEGRFRDTHRARELFHDDMLYATVTAQPNVSQVLVGGLAADFGPMMRGISRIDRLGSSKGSLWARILDGLSVTLPDQLPCKHTVVLRMFLESRANHRHPYRL